MDSILFYGDRGDASRRQVRSAAAQHSHRIGPRKPKTSKKPRADSDQRRRSLKAHALPNAILTNAVTAQTCNLVAPPPPPPPPPPLLSAIPPRPPPSQRNFTPLTTSVTALAPSPTSVKSPTTVTFDVRVHRDKEHERQADQARFQEIQAVHAQVVSPDRPPQPSIQAQHSLHPVPPPTSPPIIKQAPIPESRLPPLQVLGPLPLAFDRIDRTPSESIASPHSRTNSVASPQSPCTRLPQYSWTEYPRYGLGFNDLQTSLQMLAQVAVAEQEVSDAVPPRAHTVQDVPGFRQYSEDTTQSIKPHISQELSKSSSFGDMSPPISQSSAPFPSHSRSHIPPMATQSSSDQSPLTGPSFGQVLQRAIGGHE